MPPKASQTVAVPGYVRPTFRRIGHLTSGDRPNQPSGTPLEYMVVATVTSTDHVKFYGIDTWKLPIGRVGAYKSMDYLPSVHVRPPIGPVRPDRYFRLPLEARDVPAAVRGYNGLVSEGNAGDAGVRARSTPLWPEDITGDWNYTRDADKSGGDIAAVVTFVNEGAPQHMGLERNFNLWLDADETYASFRTFVEATAPTYDENRTLGPLMNDDDSPFNYWTDLEFWVLPRGETELVEWTREDDAAKMKARDWLRMWTVAPGAVVNRLLFIEVRIVPDPRHRAKDAAFKLRMQAAENAQNNNGS
ncbi:unnamed protein product [Zymoseptoria tritici ST99CH_1E4]|uniref:Uncharacterized protein n=1 Tax=Zymoseptoria tritici ST99CH_1E4 TaxID=1276532 RepID=A0A2H1H0Q1_ZYMTR|nr:unnamed protein product [Zymoseptoria tritici ST99CH_1E4]